MWNCCWLLFWQHERERHTIYGPKWSKQKYETIADNRKIGAMINLHCGRPMHVCGFRSLSSCSGRFVSAKSSRVFDAIHRLAVSLVQRAVNAFRGNAYGFANNWRYFNATFCIHVYWHSHKMRCFDTIGADLRELSFVFEDQHLIALSPRKSCPIVRWNGAIFRWTAINLFSLRNFLLLLTWNIHKSIIIGRWLDFQQNLIIMRSYTHLNEANRTINNCNKIGLVQLFWKPKMQGFDCVFLFRCSAGQNYHTHNTILSSICFDWIDRLLHLARIFLLYAELRPTEICTQHWRTRIHRAYYSVHRTNVTV